MKFSEIKLGTGVYFENRQRDRILDNEFDIEDCEKPVGFLLIHKVTKGRHFLSMYNVAYAKIADEVTDVIRARETSENRQTQLTLQSSSSKKGKKS